MREDLYKLSTPYSQAIMTMREDLYKLYSKLDSEGIKLDALQAVWQSFVSLQDNLGTLQTQVIRY